MTLWWWFNNGSIFPLKSQCTLHAQYNAYAVPTVYRLMFVHAQVKPWSSTNQKITLPLPIWRFIDVLACEKKIFFYLLFTTVGFEINGPLEICTDILINTACTAGSDVTVLLAVQWLRIRSIFSDPDPYPSDPKRPDSNPIVLAK